ncbi:MAG: hypothetical protein HYU41_04570 [Candidatus Rokubacteria bacterium]|nr:hypothetical protein [Candidatus Rokubacteria bacterium]
MSDYLGRLAARTLGVADVVAPRPASRFERSPSESPAPSAAETSVAGEVDGGRGETATTTDIARRATPHRSPAAPPATATASIDAESQAPAVAGRAESAVTVVAGPQASGSAPRAARTRDAGLAITPTLPAAATPRDAATSRAIEPAASPRGASARPLVPASTPRSDRDEWPRSPSGPVVHVSIGRLEVRAVRPAPSPPRPAPRAPEPALSLDDYLRQRSERRR